MLRILLLAAVAAGTTAPLAARAQTPGKAGTPATINSKADMDNNLELAKALLREEQALQFTSFTNETALELGLRIVGAAKQAGKAVTVNITRNGQVLFHHAMAGTANDNAEWIRRKNNVVNRFGHSSYYVGINYKNRGLDFDTVAYLDSKEYAAYAGAFPLSVKDVGIVGTITVSGLPGVQDHILLVGVLQDYLRLDAKAAEAAQ
jgi:uncharacterized protein (UPF0303 family)